MPFSPLVFWSFSLIYSNESKKAWKDTDSVGRVIGRVDEQSARTTTLDGRCTVCCGGI